jgi:hypothetical protein
MAAYLIGKDDAAIAGLERAHLAFLDQGEVGRAVRCAFWVGIFLFLRGRHAEGGGWLGRAGRLLEPAPDTVERGYLLIPGALQALQSGDPSTAHEVFREAAGITRRPLPAMSATSSRSSVSHRGQLPPPTPSGTSWCSRLRRLGRITHSSRRDDMGSSPEAAPRRPFDPPRHDNSRVRR